MSQGSKIVQKIVSAMKAGELDRAEGLCRKALKKDAFDFNVLNLQSLILIKKGQHQRALKILEKALPGEPNHPDMLCNLGICLKELGNYGEAEKYFNRAAMQEPANTGVLRNLGDLCELTGRWSDAMDVYKKILSISPSNVSALVSLGKSQRMTGALSEALACLNLALQADPGNRAACTEKILVLEKMGDLQGAIDFLNERIAGDYENLDLHHLLGSFLQSHGRRADAVQTFKTILANRPNDTDALMALVDLGELESTEDLRAPVQALQGSLRSARRTDEKVALNHLLFRIHDRLGESDTAFEHLQEGHKILGRRYAYSFEEEKDNFERLRQLFSGTNFHQVSGVENETPVFIVGMPRSGTSLVEQVLSSHSGILGAGELPILPALLNGANDDHHYMGEVEGWSADNLRKIAEQYLQVQQSFPGAQKFITDKLPHNFLRLGLIRLLFPNAKVIHCMRDPMDTCFSCYAHFFVSRHAYSHDLEELGRYYLLYEDLMAFWKERFPGFICDVQYETFVENLRVETTRLLEYLGLAWEAGCEDFSAQERPVRTASSMQVREGLNSRSIGAWRRYESHLEPLRAILESKPPLS